MEIQYKVNWALDLGGTGFNNLDFNSYLLYLTFIKRVLTEEIITTSHFCTKCKLSLLLQ